MVEITGKHRLTFGRGRESGRNGAFWLTNAHIELIHVSHFCGPPKNGAAILSSGGEMFTRLVRRAHNASSDTIRIPRMASKETDEF